MSSHSQHVTTKSKLRFDSIRPSFPPTAYPPAPKARHGGPGALRRSTPTPGAKLPPRSTPARNPCTQTLAARAPARPENLSSARPVFPGAAACRRRRRRTPGSPTSRPKLFLDLHDALFEGRLRGNVCLSWTRHEHEARGTRHEEMMMMPVGRAALTCAPRTWTLPSGGGHGAAPSLDPAEYGRAATGRAPDLLQSFPA